VAQLSGGEALAKSLVREGIEVIFGLPGVQMYGLITGIRDEPGLRMITARHEYSTTHMADGYARATGKPSVAMVVPGVGLYNAGSGIATAYARSSPVLLLAGEVPRAQIGMGLDGLHEIVDQADLMKPITKYRKSIMRPHEAPAAVNEAFKQMRSGRPRPTFIDMPPEGMVEREDVDLLESVPGDRETSDDSLIEEVAKDILAAKTAVIFAGGGIARSNAFDELRELAEMTGLPVVNSGGGKGVIPYSHPNSIGTWVGAEGPIKEMIDGAEVIVAIGTRFTPRNPAGGGSKVIHIDPDESILGRPHPNKMKLKGDAKATLVKLNAALDSLGCDSEMMAERHAFDKAALEEFRVQDRSDDAAYPWLVAIQDAYPDEATGIWGMTQLGYYSRQHFEVERPWSYIDSGYMGTLGYAYPTAIGAKVGVPDRPVICIVGDGGFMYASGELSTAVKYGINVVAVVFNDGAYGNVARDLDQDFGGTYEADFVNPDFVAMAEAYGGAGFLARSPEELTKAIRQAVEVDAPSIVEVQLGRLPRPKAWTARAPWTKPQTGLID
jgi:acetolactate synthase-1/2/3 large subunit